MMSNVNGALNEQQLRAAGGEGGVMLVVAGAGTGKTRTLVEKVGAIVRQGTAAPENILVLTFSRKAAEELRERVRAALGASADAIPMGTFHSFCLGALREAADDYLGWSGRDRFPAVMDDAARAGLLGELVAGRRERFLGIPDDVVLSLMEGTRRVDPRIAAWLDALGVSAELERLRAEFRERKLAAGLLDFEDMIGHFSRLLRERPAVRRRMIDRYRYILVDEFQDTAPGNFEVIELLCPDVGRNLFAVGDDAQSIYGFRGARPGYLVEMRRHFPEAAVVTLERNYRSRAEIVRRSDRFIARNRGGVRKRLTAVRGAGGAVVPVPAGSIREECARLSQIVERERAAGATIAVLYRNNWQGEAVRRECRVADASGVSLMTMHASKGLEFDAVIVIGVADGIIPDPAADIEEERRLLYVALTRARDRLYVIHRANADGSPARFARELGWGKRRGPVAWLRDAIASARAARGRRREAGSDRTVRSEIRRDAQCESW